LLTASDRAGIGSQNVLVLLNLLFFFSWKKSSAEKFYPALQSCVGSPM